MSKDMIAFLQDKNLLVDDMEILAAPLKPKKA